MAISPSTRGGPLGRMVRRPEKIGQAKKASWSHSVEDGPTQVPSDDTP